MMKCKVCGFIEKKDKIDEVCPVCGAKKVAFEPFDDPVSEKRRKILELHIHPILVHFPQAFIPLVLVILVIAIFVSDPFFTLLYNSLKVLATLAPFVVLTAASAGIFDGKMRFKKLKTPFLIRKIIFASITLATTIPVAILIHFIDIQALNVLYILIPLIFSFFGVMNLGLIGSKLICPVTKGK